MEGSPIAHTSTFKYLGHLFVCNGDRAEEFRRRTDLARATFTSLRHIWSARKIGLLLKRRIYKASVLSVLVYGHEAWLLPPASTSTIELRWSKSMAESACCCVLRALLRAYLHDILIHVREFHPPAPAHSPAGICTSQPVQDLCYILAQI